MYGILQINYLGQKSMGIPALKVLEEKGWYPIKQTKENWESKEQDMDTEKEPDKMGLSNIC